MSQAHQPAHPSAGQPDLEAASWPDEPYQDPLDGSDAAVEPDPYRIDDLDDGPQPQLPAYTRKARPGQLERATPVRDALRGAGSSAADTVRDFWERRRSRAPEAGATDQPDKISWRANAKYDAARFIGRRRRLLGYIALGAVGVSSLGALGYAVGEYMNDTVELAHTMHGVDIGDAAGNLAADKPLAYDEILRGPEPKPSDAILELAGPDPQPGAAAEFATPVVDTNLAGDHKFVWGTYADLYGAENATSTIVERAETLEQNGWHVEFRGNPRTDSVWSIESITDAWGKEYTGVREQVGALEYAQHYDTAGSHTAVQPEQPAAELQAKDEAVSTHQFGRELGPAEQHPTVNTANEALNAHTAGRELSQEATPPGDVQAADEATTAHANGRELQSDAQPPAAARVGHGPAQPVELLQAGLVNQPEAADNRNGLTWWSLLGAALLGGSLLFGAKQLQNLKNEQANGYRKPKQATTDEAADDTAAPEDDQAVEAGDQRILVYKAMFDRHTSFGEWVTLPALLARIAPKVEANLNRKMTDQEITAMEQDIHYLTAQGVLESDNRNGVLAYRFRQAG